MKNFADYKIIIYENDSRDNTKKLYWKWAEVDPKVKFISENIHDIVLSNIYPRTGNLRTHFIARARNIVLQEALKEEYDSFDYVMMVDLDEFDEWDIKNIIDSLENPQKDWHAIFANGAYDLYALRSENYCYGPELIGIKPWQEIYTVYGNHLAERLKTGEWLKVDSAFGGLAIYKRQCLKNATYGGKLNKEQIEDILNADFSRDVAFPQFSKMFRNNIASNRMLLSEWASQDCPDNSMLVTKYKDEYDFYICEHVVLHMNLKKCGFDKLYINPKLIHRSKLHHNF